NADSGNHKQTSCNQIRTIAVFLTLFLCFQQTAYGQVNIDSLTSRLIITKGNERIDVLTQLSKAFERRDPSRSIAFAKEGLILLQPTPDIQRELDLLYLKGRSHLWLSQYDSALVHAERIEVLARKEGNIKGQAESANLKGTTRSLQGHFDIALGHFSEALVNWELINNSEGIGNTLNNLGIVHMRTGKYDESLDYYMRAMITWEEMGNKPGLARVLNNTGNIYVDLEDFSIALNFYRRALTIRTNLGDSVGVAFLLNNIGLIEMNQGRPISAKLYYLRALSIWESTGGRNHIARVLINTATVHADQGDYQEALRFAKRALDIKQAIGDKRGIGIALNKIGQLHIELAQSGLALDHLLPALTFAKEASNQKLVRDIYSGLALTYEMQGNHLAALASHRLFKAVHDSLFNAESQSKLAELQTQYQTKEQQQEITTLQKQQEIQTLWRNALIAGLGFVLLITFLIHKQYQLKNRAHQALEALHTNLKATQSQLIHTEKMASLGHLTAGIAHEIKNPLNFVTNFAEITIDLTNEISETLKTKPQIRVMELSEELGDLKLNAEKISEHGKRVDSIVKNMMLHTHQNQDTRYPVGLNAFIEEFIKVSHHSLQARNPALEVKIHQQYDAQAGIVEILPQEIRQVLQNLLSNAFQAVHERKQTSSDVFSPQINISTVRNAHAVEIRISDNGIGIPEEIRDRVFEPFFSTKPAEQGTGLGLSLSYDIVIKGHGGNLVVGHTTQNGPDTGTEFIITLPAVTT
ncbi:MAG: tetratricopeptide repeat protein, partial [Rhodothermales bacterium]